MRQALLMIFLGLLACAPAVAQQPVVTNPVRASTNGGNVSGTITAGNVFQLVFASNNDRKGCTIQNNGTHNMWVEEGVSAAVATEANSTLIPVGTVFYCQAYGVVLTGPIVITGVTTGDSFYAAQY